MRHGRALIRSGNRSGTASGRAPLAERPFGRPAEPTVCEGCGAVFRNRAWRRGADATVTHGILAGAQWALCPACIQTRREEYLGRVLVRGPMSDETTAAIRRRVRNVAQRAEWTQPERRIVSIDRSGDGLEILTTSQKLAHRLVHELKKAFGGRATYRWSDDGSLFAVWRGRTSATSPSRAKHPKRA